MRYQVQSVKWLPREELINKLKENACAYSKYADSTLLFVFRHSKSDNYDFYEARFGKENFMHLVGIKSETKKAVEFYEACIKGSRYVDLEKASMPTTLLTNPLKSYCSKPQKIMFVLQKMDDEKKYTKCIYEIKKGLLEAEMKSFPDYIL